jgi:hypothetical protein
MACIMGIFALLLISATPLPSHQPEAPKTYASANQPDSGPSPVSRIGKEGSPRSTPQTSDQYSYTYYYPAAESQSPPVWFQVVTTIVLLVFTAGLWLTSVWQWSAIKEQAAISKEVLTKLEIPYVSIRKITPHVLKPRVEGKTPEPWAVIWFQFNLENSGRSVAEVTSVHSELRILGSLPMPPEYSGTIDVSAFPIGPNSISHVYWTATYKFPPDPQKMNDDFWSIMAEKMQIVCFGYIRYKDPLGARWKSGFCWKWNPHNDGAYLAGGRYYNYNRKDEPYTGLSEPE